MNHTNTHALGVVTALASVNGHVSIEGGVASLPDGTSIPLVEPKSQRYLVEVCRTAYGNITMPVTSLSGREAAEIALDYAGNESFSEHSADYSVLSVVNAQTHQAVEYEDPEPVPTRAFIVLPSADGAPFYLHAFGPEGMAHTDALVLVNTTIAQVNAEDATSSEAGGGCNDGKVVEDVLKERLTACGFAFLKGETSIPWDSY